jgi:protein-tyrosine-phosphatase
VEIKSKEKKMKILFICKHNVFRSRIAEEYFKKINRNKKIEVISRGIVMGGHSDKEQRGISKQLLGIDIDNRTPISLKLQDLENSDMIIVVANDIPRRIFDYQKMYIQNKVFIWKVKDEQLKNKKNIKRTTLEIKKRVDKLVRRLNGKI